MRSPLTNMKKVIQLPVTDERGFTILELMFVIAIFGIMSTISLFGFRNFSQKTAFDNLAQDIALHIVQAQKAAISGSVNSVVLSTATVPPTYGVNFTSGATPVPANQLFTYFNDLPVYNGRYDAPTGGGCPSGFECLSITKITSGEYVDQISYVPSGGGMYVPLSSGASVNVSFTRPFPDANILCTSPSPGECILPLPNVYIQLASTLDPTQKKTIVVNSLGEVRVYNGSTMCAYSGGSGC